MLDSIAVLYPAAFQLPYEQLRIGIALLGTGIATYYDLSNNRNVPNMLLYAFLAAAILVNAFGMADHLVYTVAVSAAIFAAGWLFYRAGQIGGADVFVLASISLLLPVQPLSLLQVQPQSIPQIAMPFALYVFAISGLLFILAMLANYAPSAFLLLAKGRVRIPLEKWAYIAALLALFAAFLYFAQSAPFIPSFYIILLGLLVVASAFFMLFRDHVREQMLELVPFQKIEEEDVLALERISPALVARYQIPRVVSQPDIARLKKANIKLAKWPVYKKMHVFLPYILIGLIALLLLGDPFLLLSGF
jgi:hypothetical protein